MTKYRTTMTDALNEVAQYESRITKLKNGVKVMGNALPNKAMAKKMADKANRQKGVDADVYQSPFNNRFYVRIKEIAPAIAGIARAAAAGAGAAVANKAMNASKKKVKEQENDPVAKAQDKLDKAKQIAQLKKQIDTIKATDKKEAVDSDDTGGAAEVDMIMNQVNQMRHFLDGIEKMVQDDGDVEEWVQSKITKATDYLKTAYSYKTGEKNEALDKEDEPAVKKLVKNLRKGSKTHAKQADELEKDLKDETDLEEFTDAQIARLKKEYEPLKGKETGIALDKFDKLRKILKRLQKPQLLKLVKAELPIVSSAAKARLVINHGMKWSQLPEELVPYCDLDDLQESKFKSVEPKVIDRIEKMMRGSRSEKDSIANLLNYLMPPEVVDMVRYKLKIKQPRGKIKF